MGAYGTGDSVPRKPPGLRHFRYSWEPTAHLFHTFHPFLFFTYLSIYFSLLVILFLFLYTYTLIYSFLLHSFYITLFFMATTAAPTPPTPPTAPIFTGPPLSSLSPVKTGPNPDKVFDAIKAKTPKPLENPKPDASVTGVELWFNKALNEPNYANLLTSYFKGNPTYINFLNSWYKNNANDAQKDEIQKVWPGYNPSAPKPAAAAAAKGPATTGDDNKGSVGTGASKKGSDSPDMHAELAAKLASLATKKNGTATANVKVAEPKPASPVAAPVVPSTPAKAASKAAATAAPKTAKATSSAAKFAASAATAAATAAAAAYAAKSDGEKKILFDGFHKKLKMGVPVAAVKIDMTNAGISDDVIADFIKGPQDFIDTKFPAPVAAPSTPVAAPDVAPPSGVAQLFVEFKDLSGSKLSGKDQCQQIVDAVKCLVKKGYKRVGLTYSANQKPQTQTIFGAYNFDPKSPTNDFDIGVAKTIAQTSISGANQAATLMGLDKLTDDDFRKVFRIIPLSTMKVGGGGIDVDETALGKSADCVEFAKQFLALPNSIILGWCDPYTKKNSLSLLDLNPTDLLDIGKLVDDAYTLSGKVPITKIQAPFEDPATAGKFYLDKTKSVVFTNTTTGADYLAKRKKHINIGGEMAETTTNTRTTYIPLYLKFLVGKWNRDAQLLVDECQSASPITTPTPVKITPPVLGADSPPKDAPITTPPTTPPLSPSTPAAGTAGTADRVARMLRALCRSLSTPTTPFRSRESSRRSLRSASPRLLRS